MIRKIRKSDLFLIFVYLNVFCKGIGLNNDSFFYQVLMIFGIIAVVIKLFLEKYQRRELLIVVIICSIGMANFILTRTPTLLLTCVCLSGMKGVNIDSLFKGMYYIRLITFISMIALSLTGIIENSIVQMWRNGNFDTRYTLGFGHPNTLHISLFILLSLYIYLNFDKLDLKRYVFLFASNIYIYSFSKSRTGLMGCTILLLLCIVSKSNRIHIKSLLYKAPKITFLFMIAFSYVTAVLYGRLPILTLLNALLNNRIVYSSYFIQNYGLTLFGSNIDSASAILDSSYIAFLALYGIVGFILIGIILFSVCKYVESQKDMKKIVLVLAYLIYIFTEGFGINIFMNIILLFFGSVLYKSDHFYRRSKV